MSCSLAAQSKSLRIREYARGLLRGVKDAIHHRIIRGNAVLFQPEEYIGFSAHGADLDHLVEAEKMRGYAAVNGIGKRSVVLSKRLHQRGSVNARSGSKSVVAHDGIIRRNGSVCGLGDFLAIFLEPRKILMNQIHQAKIDKHQFHRRIAHALTESVGGGVNLMRACSDGRERIRNRQAAVVMAVPIHANLFAGGFHHLVDGKLDEIECAARCSVADRVAQNDGARPASNGCETVKRLYSAAIRSG